MDNELTFKKATENHFNETAKDYNNGHDGQFVKPMYEEIVKRTLDLNPDAILDLGCGNGNVLKLLEDKTRASLYGLDLSKEMISEAEKQLNINADLTIGDSESLPYEDNKFDVIICNASFHHYTKPEKVLSEIKRVLKDNGTLILGDPTIPTKLLLSLLNYSLHHSNTGDYKIYNKKEITKLLNNCGFKIDNFKMTNCKSFILNAKKTPAL